MMRKGVRGRGGDGEEQASRGMLGKTRDRRVTEWTGSRTRGDGTGCVEESGSGGCSCEGEGGLDDSCSAAKWEVYSVPTSTKTNSV